MGEIADDHSGDFDGFGVGNYRRAAQGSRAMPCKFCGTSIRFENRKALEVGSGKPHRCEALNHNAESSAAPQATLFAMSAMSAIIGAQIQKAGVDHIHRMNFYDVADAAWRAAAAMVKSEKTFRDEIGD